MRSIIRITDCGRRTTRPGAAQKNKAVVATVLPVLNCPSEMGIRNLMSEATTSPPAAVGSYAVNMGNLGPSTTHSSKIKMNNTGVFAYLVGMSRRKISDGLSKTMFVGEVIEGHLTDGTNIWSSGGRYGDSMRITENPLNTAPGEGIVDATYTPQKQNGAFGSRHSGGANFVFGDGHTTFITDNISKAGYQALSTKAGGETIADQY
ncbi:MAG: DUF1559 domain-containing protein [Pirellulales bacterium]